MSVAELELPQSISVSTPKWLSRFLSPNDLAMDLGTANTLIYAARQGIILNEPSVVAVDEETGKPISVGIEAKESFGRTGRNVRCIRPMKDGVISDFEMTSLMIKTFISRVRRGWSIKKPRLVVGVPSGITPVEKKAVIEAVRSSGISEVLLCEEPMAAAIGAGLPVERAQGNMVVDIGGGTTEVAVVSLNGIVYSHSIRVAGDELDEAIERLIRRQFGVKIGIFDAERIKIALGSALPTGTKKTIQFSGTDISSGIPRHFEISDALVRIALQEPIQAMVSSVITGLENCTPEIAHDILLKGIWLTGGGSLLRGLAERLSRETGLKFQVAADPLSCVARGVGTIVDNLKTHRRLCLA
jgi:rod shape-determining protein MreB